MTLNAKALDDLKDRQARILAGGVKAKTRAHHE